MNENMRRCFYDRNLFDYKHIKPFDNSYVDSPGPMVLFSPPGMTCLLLEIHQAFTLYLFKICILDLFEGCFMVGSHYAFLKGGVQTQII